MATPRQCVIVARSLALWLGLVGAMGGGRALGAAAFPLGVSANRHYLVDQNGTPFFMVGDAAQSAAGALTLAEFRGYIDTRVSQGFNTINVNVVEDVHSPNPPADRSGDRPFTSAGDFSTANDTYFAGVAQKIAYALSKGVFVLLAYYSGHGVGDPGYDQLVSNSLANCQGLGTYLANGHGAFGGFKGYPNVAWVWGADHLFTSDTAPRDCLHAIAQYMKSAGSTQLMSGDWGIPAGNSGLATAQAEFRTYMDLQNTYAYLENGGIPGTARAGYSYIPSSASSDGRALSALPQYLKETGYEGESTSGETGGAPATNLRFYQWTAILNGDTTGLLYGHRDVWGFATPATGYSPCLFPGCTVWTSSINSAGAQDMARLSTFIRSIAWHKLAPSGPSPFLGRVLIGGGQDSSAGGDVSAAADPAGTLLLAYVPSTGTGARSLNIDPRSMSGAARARWWDPTSGAFTDAGSIPNTGTQVITSPGANAAGANDWLLVLDAAAVATAAPSVAPAKAVSSGGCNQGGQITGLLAAALAAYGARRWFRRAHTSAHGGGMPPLP